MNVMRMIVIVKKLVIFMMIKRKIIFIVKNSRISIKVVPNMPKFPHLGMIVKKDANLNTTVKTMIDTIVR